MTPGPPMMAMLESYLKLTASRVQAISANMANIDTPGYRTRDINFESEFHKVMSGSLASIGGRLRSRATESGLSPGSRSDGAPGRQ